MLSLKLKELRNKKKCSQEVVADYLDISKSAYGYYESGRNMPSVEILLKLAKFFGVSTDYLLDREKASDGGLCFGEIETQYGHQTDDADDILNRLKEDPATRMVAKISGDLTEEGKKDLLKYAELLRNQRDSGRED